MGAADGYRLGSVATDLLVVASVPLLLGAIHLLVPPAVQARYVLPPTGYGPVTLFTAAFLHAGDAHLLGNVAGYTIGALAAYLLCLLIDERRWFRFTTLLLVLALPILVNWTAIQAVGFYVEDWSAASRGFSGVAAGFGGFAYAALLAFVARQTDRTTAYFAGMAILLVLCWEVLLIYADRLPRLGTGLVVLGVGLCVIEIGRRHLGAEPPATTADWLRLAAVLVLVLGLVGVLMALTVVMFPPTLVEDGQFTNVFAHAIGFGAGFVIAGWGYRYWRTTYRSRPVQAE